MSSFFSKLAKATPTLTQGLVQGVKLRQDMEDADFKRKQAAANADIQRQELDVRKKYLDAMNKKAEQDQIDSLAKQYGEGLMVIDGQPQVNPAFITPGTDLYKFSQRNAELKRGMPNAPRTTWGQTYAVLGRPVPAGIDPNLPMPDSVAARLLSANGSAKGGVLTADQLSQLRAGTLKGDIPVPSGYINAIPRPNDAKTLTAGQLKQLQEGTLDPSIPVPPSYANWATQGAIKPPPGFGWNADKTGFVAIPGGPGEAALEEKRTKIAAEKKKSELADEKNQKAKIEAQDKAQRVLQDANRALDILQTQPPGMLGAIQQGIASNIPGTEAADLEGLLETVRTIGGFESLQAMRNASPTGGALGQVSDSENRMLQATLGNLSKMQSPAQRTENLKRIANIYMDAYYGPGNGPDRYPLSFDEQGKSLNRSQQRAKSVTAPQPTAPSSQRAASAKKLGINTDKIDQYPRPGDVVDGYRYKGGDPSIQSNWEKAK